MILIRGNMSADQADEGFDATQVVWNFFKQHAR
jgi:polyhydroxybutyrate depolymerase